MYQKNVTSLTKQLNDVKTLSDRQRQILTERVKAYKNDNLRGTEKGFSKELKERAKKYGKIKGLDSQLFLKNSIEFHAQERAWRSILPQVEKKLKQIK